MELKEICQAIGIDENEAEFHKGVSVLRNRFYTGIIFPDKTILERTKECIEFRKKRYNDLIKDKEYAAAIFLIERPFRFDEFLDLRLEIEEEKGMDHAGKVCADVWIDSENPGININVWKGLFKRYGENLMDDEDKEVWDKLPDRFEVWHGDEGEHDGMISWTLSKKVAEFFARRFTDNQRAVTSKIVNKSECLCYFGGRSEEEIIIL